MKTQGKSGLKLARLPPCSALPIAPLPSISEIPFSIPAFLLSLLNKDSSLGGRETDDFLFAAAGDVRRRHECDFHVFLGARHQIAAATQVKLVFDVLAMALDGFDTQVERIRDLGVAKA